MRVTSTLVKNVLVSISVEIVPDVFWTLRSFAMTLHGPKLKPAVI